MRRRPTYPPDYCDIDALAYRLSMSAELVRQLVRRGLLPEPSRIGEAERWRWADVDAALGHVAGGPALNDTEPSPYQEGLANVAPAAPRASRHRPRA